MDSLIALFNHQFMAQPLWIWTIFIGIVITILVLDLGVFNRNIHEIKATESIKMCSAYALIAGLFGLWIWYSMGMENGLDFFTGYLIEFSLSIDNIFVISLIFTYFAIPAKFQHRVLFFGILGAIILRGIMIIIGAELVKEFAWILYIFGAFLLFSGIKMLLNRHNEQDESIKKDSPLIRFISSRLRVTNEFAEQKFFVKRPSHKGSKRLVWFATPLFLTLVVIEVSDVIFAVDSIPAIFVITQEAFIVFTSNIFAILGLRSLYFLLAAAVHRFKYLKDALSLILIFIGSKIFLALMGVHISSLLSLSVTLGLISGGVVVSLYKTKQLKKAKGA